MINTVGFYQARSPCSQHYNGAGCACIMHDADQNMLTGRAQIAKLLIIPFVCLVEAFWLGKVFTRSVVGAVLTVVAGVAIVCVARWPPCMHSAFAVAWLQHFCSAVADGCVAHAWRCCRG